MNIESATNQPIFRMDDSYCFVTTIDMRRMATLLLTYADQIETDKDLRSV